MDYASPEFYQGMQYMGDRCMERCGECGECGECGGECRNCDWCFTDDSGNFGAMRGACTIIFVFCIIAFAITLPILIIGKAFHTYSTPIAVLYFTLGMALLSSGIVVVSECIKCYRTRRFRSESLDFARTVSDSSEEYV